MSGTYSFALSPSAYCTDYGTLTKQSVSSKKQTDMDAVIGPNDAVSEDLDPLDPQDLEDPANYGPFYDEIDTIRGEMEDIKATLRCKS